MVPTPYSDIAPRFGFAATLKGNIVLRGGFGITFMPQNYESQYYFQNAPFDFALELHTPKQRAQRWVQQLVPHTPIGPYPMGEFGSPPVRQSTATPTSGSTKNSSTLGQQGGTTFAEQPSRPDPVDAP